MQHKQIKPEDIRTKFMTSLIDFELKCSTSIFIIDYDITINTLVTQYLVQELGAGNTYIIVKAAPSSVEFDLKPVRDICYTLDCSHILIISARDKVTMLKNLHKQTGKSLVVLTDDIKYYDEYNNDLSDYCEVIDLIRLIP